MGMILRVASRLAWHWACGGLLWIVKDTTAEAEQRRRTMLPSSLPPPK